jgi:hypothetical protein
METVENKKTRTPRPKGSVVDYLVTQVPEDFQLWQKQQTEAGHVVKTAIKSITVDGEKLDVNVGIARRRLKAVTTYVEE